MPVGGGACVRAPAVATATMDGLVVPCPGQSGRRQQERPERHPRPPSRHRVLLKIIDLFPPAQSAIDVPGFQGECLSSRPTESRPWPSQRVRRCPGKETVICVRGAPRGQPLYWRAAMRVLLSCGETSGDLYAGELVRELGLRQPGIEV